MKQGKRRSYSTDVVHNLERNTAVVRAALDRLHEGRAPGIIFCREKAHVAALAGMLQSALGHAVPAVSADVSERQRLEWAEAMRAGKLQLVVATSVWGTGVDIPSLRWVLWAGAGQAPIGLVQGVGRGSRVAEGKEAFEFIEIADVSLGGRYLVQHKQRLDHLAEAGYDLSDMDVQFMDALLQHRETRARGGEPAPVAPPVIGQGLLPGAPPAQRDPAELPGAATGGPAEGLQAAPPDLSSNWGLAREAWRISGDVPVWAAVLLLLVILAGLCSSGVN